MKKLKLYLFIIVATFFSTTSLAISYSLSTIKKDNLTDYQILADSTNRYDFGYRWYYSGMRPGGRVAIDNLILNEDYQTIRSVLDGTNNEGKIFAIEALLILNIEKKIKLTEIEKMKIKGVVEEDLVINRCQGCFVSTIRTIDLFNEKKFKQLLSRNKIKIITR